MKFCKRCNTETKRDRRGDCKPCARARIVAWRAANPGKDQANSAAYRAANPEKVRAMNAAWNAANVEKVRAKQAAWYAANAEKILAKVAAWRKANPEKAAADTAAWRKANPEKKRIIDQNRRARKMANGGKLSHGLSARLLKLQHGKCACCKQPLGDDYQLDHIMPLALGGTNTDENIQLLRAICNNQKAAKHPVDFMRQRGFLL